MWGLSSAEQALLNGGPNMALLSESFGGAKERCDVEVAEIVPEPKASRRRS